MRRHQKTGRFTRRRQANIPACRTQFQRHRTPSSRGRASMPHSVPPATAETSMARVRRPGDSILPRLTSPIQRRSPCSRKAISSGESRRAASASRSKGCHGNPRCLAGRSNFPTNGSGKSSWASTMERINRRGRGSSGTDGLSPLLAEQRRGWSLLISCARATRSLRREGEAARLSFLLAERAR